ncbi:cation/H(+) antiporter 20-like [Canna indica]|uniref:Cation/H(+) antiporter 20-like n=1 Tax=Canna indica TaxID=4628 RepID=A0AAQ3Q2C6_9LILI|nr:cation/H(+) antiporter 20-like [Canna indica]
MAVNITSVKTSSNGVWQGDNPLHFAFPLLIVQTTLVLLLSRSLSFLLKPLRQPNVIAEIVGGIFLGPSALGRNKSYLHTIFPSWSTPILDTVASIGLLFFLFLVGLELDLRSILRSGRRAFAIAAAGISLPFACGIGVAFVLRSAVPGADESGYAPFLVFMGVSLSITAFPVLARILAELKLLTAPVGETAMAAAAFNDVAAWVLLALAVALSGSTGEGSHHSTLVSLWVLLSGAAFVAVQMLAVRPAMAWVAKRAESEVWIALTLVGVLVSGFFTDFIGIHAIFGAFVFGLMVPKEGEFAGRLIERIEDFVTGLLLPLYFASSGLKTNVASIKGGRSWGLLALVICTACTGKIVGTFVVAVACRMAVRDAVALGVLMNTKGLVELIVLNIGKERKVLNDETFAILVLMALFTTFVTTPTVMAIYKPARASDRRRLHRSFSSSPPPSSASDPKVLRVLACAHGPRDAPSLIALIEAIRGPSSPLKLYVLHLLELTERSSSIVMARRNRRNGLPFLNPLLRRQQPRDPVALAFDAYGQLGRVSVRSMAAISALSTMHEDICNVAEDKRVALLIVPFHKRQHRSRGDEGCGATNIENVGHGWRSVNQRVLRESPCSVAVLVDRGFGEGEQVGPSNVARQVCVLFFGGPDDREAVELASRMAEHPGIRVTVVKLIMSKNGIDDSRQNVTLRPSPLKSTEQSYTFSTAVMDRERENERDEAVVEAFRRRTEGSTAARYEEKEVGNVIEAVLTFGRSGEYDLVMVGKGRFPTSMVAGLADRQAEHPELGPIGDVLASSNHGVVSSVLVVQQHDVVHSDETPVSMIFGEGGGDASVIDVVHLSNNSNHNAN